ncbi:MAG: hypothetical protein HQK51_04360 [Oligoflexia bacterium]|nr:hypothetical protein [Oligoflexia bacterium]
MKLFEKFLKFTLIFVFISISLVCCFLYVNDENHCFGFSINNKILDINAVGGLPQLLGGEVAFVGVPYLVFGVGYGYYPINSYLQKHITIKNIALGTDFEIIPSQEYTLNTYSGFIRLFPFNSNNSGFFIQLGYAPWKLNAKLQGDLYSKKLKKKLFDDIITGRGELEEKIFAFTIGHQLLFSNGIFIIGGVGISKLERPDYTLEIQGNYLTYMLMIPSLKTEYENAKAEVQGQVDKKIDEFYIKYKYIPSAFLGIGFRF